MTLVHQVEGVQHLVLAQKTYGGRERGKCTIYGRGTIIVGRLEWMDIGRTHEYGATAHRAAGGDWKYVQLYMCSNFLVPLPIPLLVIQELTLTRPGGTSL